MACFGIHTQIDQKVYEFVKKTNIRLNSSNLIKNPFKDSYIHIVRLNDGLLVIFRYNIPISSLMMWGVLFCLVCILAFWLLQWTVALFLFIIIKSILLVGVSFAQWPAIAFMLMMGLKKSGYNGKMDMINPAQTLEEVMIVWDSEK